MAENLNTKNAGKNFKLKKGGKNLKKKIAEK